MVSVTPSDLGIVLTMLQTILTVDRGVCQSVCLSRGTQLHCAKMDEWIKILLG